ncbi:hypothetical protein PENTCL1PPCAC_23875, partial [Pristionchus entomophagus]
TYGPDHTTFLSEDSKLKMDCMKKCVIHRPDHRPTAIFLNTFWSKYGDLLGLKMDELNSDQLSAMNDNPLLFVTGYTMNRFKSEVGGNVMNELHEHIGETQTYCPYCRYTTGDREAFYRHFISSSHMKNVALVLSQLSPPHFCVVTALINVYRKDLV